MNSGKPKRKVTIKDIARELDISDSTVSRALSDSPLISAEVKQKVKCVARRMNYVPNALARELSVKKSKAVGIVISEFVNSQFMSSVLSVVSETLAANGYVAYLCNSRNDLATERNYLRFMLERQVEEIIFAPVIRRDTNAEIIKRMVADDHVHFVFFDKSLPGIADADFVGSDNEYGAYEATKILINQGSERIYFYGVSTSSSEMDRYKGCLRAAEERGLGNAVFATFFGCEFESDVYRPGSMYCETVKLLDSVSEPFAIFTINSDLAEEVIYAMSRYSKEKRASVCVATFDPISAGEFFGIPVVNVLQNTQEIGKKVTDIVVRRLTRRGQKMSSQLCRIKPTVIYKKGVL